MNAFPIKLAGALFRAQGQLRGVSRDAENPHFRNRYATLENVVDTVRPVLQKLGVVFIQAPGGVDDNGVMHITTHLVHAESGETFSSTIGVPLAKRDPQAAGSAVTYACRYSLMALLGLPPIDDDGEAAKGDGTITQTQADQLRDLLESKGATVEKFLASANIDKLESLPADQYQRAVRAINQYSPKKAA